MSQPTLAEIIARAVFDKAFQERLLADPEAVLTESGLEAKPEWVAKIRQIDPNALARATRKMEKGFFDTAATDKG